MALIPCDHSVCDYDCDYDRDCDYDHDDQSYWSDMDSLYAMSFGSGGTCCPSPSEIGEDEDGHFGLEAEGFKIAHEVRYGKDMMKRAEEKERRRRKRLERRTNRGGRRRTRRVRVGRGRGCGFKEEGAEDLGIVAVEVTEDVSEDVIEIPTGLNRTEDGSRGSEVEGESLSWPRSLEHLDELQETGVGMGAGSSHAEVQLSDLMRPVRSRTGRDDFEVIPPLRHVIALDDEHWFKEEELSLDELWEQVEGHDGGEGARKEIHPTYAQVAKGSVVVV